MATVTHPTSNDFKGAVTNLRIRIPKIEEEKISSSEALRIEKLRETIFKEIQLQKMIDEVMNCNLKPSEIVQPVIIKKKSSRCCVIL